MMLMMIAPRAIQVHKHKRYVIDITAKVRTGVNNLHKEREMGRARAFTRARVRQQFDGFRTLVSAIKSQ